MTTSLNDQLANGQDDRKDVDTPASTTTTSEEAHDDEGQQTKGAGEDAVDGLASPSLDRPILTPEHRRLNAESLATLDGTALAANIAFREAHKNNTPEELIAHLRMFAAMGEEHRRERAEAGRT